MSHRIWLRLPPRYSSSGPRYDAYSDAGELIVKGSLTPLLDAARILLTREITGRVELWDASRSHPRMAGDIETIARLKVIESEPTGPRFARWMPFPADRGTLKTADRLSNLSQHPPTRTAKIRDSPRSSRPSSLTPSTP